MSVYLTSTNQLILRHRVYGLIPANIIFGGLSSFGVDCIGPHDFTTILFHMVRTQLCSQIPPNDLENLRCQYRYNQLRTAEDLRRLEPSLLDLLESIPTRFLPTHLIFMRIDGCPFVCSTNCHIDQTMKFPLSPTNPSDFKPLLLSARTQYIDAIVPHITVAEREFKKQMKELNVRKLSGSNAYHREKVYTTCCDSTLRPHSETTAFHTWSAAWQLRGKR